jgi:hypothetical protein
MWYAKIGQQRGLAAAGLKRSNLRIYGRPKWE